MSMPAELQELYDELRKHWTSPDGVTAFETALTRRAWNLENGFTGSPDHESMEWLGDRVLGAIIAGELWRRFPHAAPGDLDLARDELTSVVPLANIARSLDLIPHVRMGSGERTQRQVENDKALSDHLEALVAAAFLAGGWHGAHAFVVRLFADRIPNSLPEADARLTKDSGHNALTSLNMLVQQRWRRTLGTDAWSVVRCGGTDNAPAHQATVRLPDGTIHAGNPVEGSKQTARGEAARVALLHLRS